MHNRSVRTLLLAGIVAILFAAVPSANHSWGGYHWARTSNPLVLKTGDNVSTVWDAHLDLAISDWNLSPYVQLVEVAGGTRPRQCKATAGQIEVCNESYGFNGWLGIAQIWLSGGHISQAIAKMNDSYFDTPTYNTWSWRQLVMCQEIAHDFGLDHQDENFDNPNLGSCMDYSNSPIGNEHPNQHDYDQIATIYGSHTDSSNSATAALPGSNGAEPNSWGQLVRSSRNGRVHIYELDLGGGNKIITHVFWADPEGDAKRGR